MACLISSLVLVIVGAMFLKEAAINSVNSFTLLVLANISINSLIRCLTTPIVIAKSTNTV